MAYELKINDAELAKSAVTYRKELLTMPVIAAQATLQHMSARPGVAGREVVGELSGDIELAPYNATRVDDKDVTVKSRTLETFLGSVIKRFDPNSAAKTVYGSLITQGEALASVDIAQQVLYFLAAKLGGALNKSIWSAKRNGEGNTTASLFNGFDTITEAEITATNIATAKGNLVEINEAVTKTNAYDVLTNLYNSASDELKEQSVKMYLPGDVYRAYCDDYLAHFGAVPYNTQYKKTFLEGSDGLCELVPLASKKGSKYIHIAPQGNMLYGYGDGMADEKIAVEKHHEFLLSFVATMYFGVQFESISPERLMVGKLTA